MRQTLINTAEDCQWLRETHLSERNAVQPVPAFASAVIHGNEDCPTRLELYTAAEPLITDTPIVFVYDDETGKYQQQ